MKARRLGAALCVVLTGGSASAVGAGQLRPVSAGVYSAEQAARGEQLFHARCGD
jgi:hypothetical protein